MASGVRRDVLVQDVRYGVRMLRKTPVLSGVALLCLASAIGLTTAAFSVVYGAFFSALPVPHGDRLMMVHEYHRTGRYNVPLTVAEYALRRERTRAFENLGAWYSRNVTVARASETTATSAMVRAAYISPNSLEIVGVLPTLGRLAEEGDVAPGTSPVVILGHSVWVNRFGADPDILDDTVRISGTPHRVIGVMPPQFAFPVREALWIPVQMDAGAGNATEQFLTIFGRLRTGVSMTAAAAELSALGTSDARRDGALATIPIVMPFERGFLDPEHEWAIYGFFVGLTLFVLVIAANVANLFFARNSVRTREIAVRSALGATRARLVRQLLIESLALGAGAALLGLALSRGGVAWFRSQVEDVPWWADFSLNVTVLWVTILVGLLASAVAGIGPALRLTSNSISTPLKEGATTTSLRFSRVGASLVALQIAVSVGFLGVVGVLAQGLFGFDYRAYRLPAAEVLVAQVYLGPPDQSELSRPAADRRAIWRRHSEQSLQQFERIADRLRSLPGVLHVTMATHVPGNDVESIRIELGSAAGETHQVLTRIAEVGPGFFETLAVRLVHGRDFDPVERVGPPRSVIVNVPFARKYFPSESPIGKSLRRLDDTGAPADPWLQIVGVAPDLGLNPGDPGRADGIYLPFQPSNFARLAIRTASPPASVVPRLHEIVLDENRNAQLQSAQTLEAHMLAAESLFRGLGVGLALVGGTALLLSAVSFYSLVSFSVTRRTREIAVRLALGAPRSGIVWNVVGRELKLMTWGAATGVLIGAGVYELVALVPFDLRPAGPSLLAVVAGLMLFVGAGACLLPTRRALAIQPAEALRQH
jgi:predicted permease